MVTSDIASVAPGGIYCDMLVNGQNVRLQVDCGATVNVLPKKYCEGQDIRPESVNLRMWNGSTLQALGKCKIKTINPKTGTKYKVDYVVVDDDLRPLLSRNAAEKMDLITINYQNFKTDVPTVSVVKGTSIFEDFASVFDGELGKLPGKPVHLTVRDGAVPVIKPARNLPEALKPRVQAEIERLEKAGVIQQVDQPTDWVSQMSVAEKKNGDIRLCIDPRPLNEALMREHFTLPVLEDVLPKLSDATKFSVFDLQQGYLQCELDEESSLLTSFSTAFGKRYCWKRLPFGLSTSLKASSTSPTTSSYTAQMTIMMTEPESF
jgi:hypothetical protein